jgi:hypothetical protein
MHQVFAKLTCGRSDLDEVFSGKAMEQRSWDEELL